MIDEISYKILNILQEKARIPNVEVARQVGLTPSAVLERIRKLEKQGIIAGYEVRLNPDHFDRRMVAFVTVRVTESAGNRDIGRQFCMLPEVQEVHYTAGEDGYVLKLRVSGTRSLEQCLREKIQTIEGVVSTRTAIVMATFKETAQISFEPEMIENLK